MHFVFVSHLFPAANDADFEQAGLGGSDSALVLLTRALAKAGHRVEAYTTSASTGTFHGVVYLNVNQLARAGPCDVLVAVNGNAGEWIRAEARHRLFWITEFIGDKWETTIAPFVDRIVCLSAYHRQSLEPGRTPTDPGKLGVLDLGVVEEDYFDTPPEEVPAKPGRRLIYCSMPDRGLEHLARLFPQVRRQVPDAELTITSDFSLWGQPPANERYRALFYGRAGVRFFGKVPRPLLVELQRSARVMAYPCSGGERFSISTAECIAAGAVPVTTNDFGLRTTVAESGILVDGRPGEAAYDEHFVTHVVRLLTDDRAQRDLAIAGRRAAYARFRWAVVAERFAALARPSEPICLSSAATGSPGPTVGQPDGAGSPASIAARSAQGKLHPEVPQPPPAPEVGEEPVPSAPPDAGPAILTMRVPEMPRPLPPSAPSICVAIPLYNMAEHLYRAVLSALWQLDSRDELVVVDDASSDLAGGYAGLEPFMDRIRWIRNPVNRGLPYSRNRAIESTRAEWIKFLDADDVLAPFALNLIRRADPPIAPHIHVVAGGCHRIVNFVHADYLQSTAEVLQSIKLVNPLLTSAAFIRRAALLAVGMYDERIDFEEDWDMWLRLHERFGLGCFAAVTTPVCYYWIHKTERQGKRRHATIEGMPGREYFRRRYGCQPPE